MKKTLITIIICVVAMLSFNSCNKDKGAKEAPITTNETLMNSNYDASVIRDLLSDYHSDVNIKDCPGWWQRLKKWIKAHTGTHLFNNCNGNNPCGPCAGICFQLGTYPIPVEDEYELTQDDIESGDNVFILGGLDETHMAITFIDNADFIFEDTFYLQEDWDLGQDVAQEFQVASIIIKQGNYPVIYEFNENGETVVEVEVTWE